MKIKFALTAIAAFASTAAFAQEEQQPPTRSFEGENVEASKSASYDAETQTVTREGSATNKNTGETITQTQQRQFTENGSVYTGGFRQARHHGEGEMRYADGHVYVGGWQNGTQHGGGKIREE